MPHVLIVACPGCGKGLELAVEGWQLARCSDEEENKGIGLQLTAWSPHECGSL